MIVGEGQDFQPDAVKEEVPPARMCSEGVPTFVGASQSTAPGRPYNAAWREARELAQLLAETAARKGFA